MGTDYTQDFIIDSALRNAFPAAPFFCLVSTAYKICCPAWVLYQVHGRPTVPANNLLFIEIPAGKLEVGEKPYDCVVRELREETGLVANDLMYLGVFYPSPGYTDEPLHIFIAKSFTQGEACLDEHELLNLKKIKLQDALQMVYDNVIRDAKTVIALLRYAALNK